MMHSFYIILKAAEAFLKIALSVSAPLILGISLSGELYLVLTIVFMLAAFMMGGSEMSILRIYTQDNISAHSKIFVLKSFTKLVITLLVFQLIFFFFLKQLPVLENINDAISLFWKEIIISALFFSIISIIAWGLRAEGQIIANQLIIGIYWPMICFIYVFFIGYTNILNLNFPTFLMLAFILLTPFITYRLIKKIKHIPSKQQGIIGFNVFKYNATFFIQTVSVVFLQWSPILIVGIISSGEELGFFSIVYRLSMGIMTAIIISNMIGSRLFSEYHQSKDTNRLKILYDRLTKLSIFFGVIGFICCICVIFYIAYQQNLSINFVGPCYLLLSVTLTTFFGPSGMFLNMVDKEKDYRKVNIFTLISFIVIGLLGIFYLSIDLLYFLFGTIIFLQAYAAYCFKNNYFKETL